MSEVPDSWLYYNGVYYDPDTGTYIVANDGDEWYNTTSEEHVRWWNIQLRDGPGWWDLSFYELHDEGEWVEGEGATLPIEWYYFQDWIDLDTQAEVTDFQIEPETLAHEGGGHFDAFALKRSLLFDKLFGTYVTHICLEEVAYGDMPLEIPLFGSVKDGLWCEIKSVDILPLASTSFGANDRVQFRVHNSETAGTVCTRTIMETDDLVKGRTMRFSSPAPAHAFVNFSYGLYLFVEIPATYDGVTIPRSLIVIQWDIADLGEGT